ncbi:WbqC family protein [Alicyclobacillus tolerans]|uniref:WbqC family protein n=1 Tax=Alicyclobacillus tolerans TaxID=90970 RepID=UPI001F3FFD33|nr:WbqC family protein [Alicyclobacillus tolerans]MCF8567767.1 WbqC family protein [Alicyclobacillus tolerans]
MRLGIMQPYFFPHLGHFALIAHTDRWVVFDITQYTPKSWMNRNRILHPSKGWNYITVPLSNSSISIKTHEARILDVSAAHKSILGKLSHYRKKAPYFSQVESLVNSVFANSANDSLVQLNVRGLIAICDYLGIHFRYEICSEMHLPLPERMGPGQWAPRIAGLLRASRYINPIGGRALFDPKDFKVRGVKLSFLDVPDFVYNTWPYHFESRLSILDVLMWNEPGLVRDAIRRADIVDM